MTHASPRTISPEEQSFRPGQNGGTRPGRNEKEDEPFAAWCASGSPTIAVLVYSQTIWNRQCIARGGSGFRSSKGHSPDAPPPAPLPP